MCISNFVSCVRLCIGAKLTEPCIMKYLFTVSITIIAILIYGCSKTGDSVKKEIDFTKTYKGIIITADCPSFAYIQVENDNIGERWDFNNKTFSNVIGISNMPDSIKSDTIYFALSKQTNYKECIAQRPCLMLYAPLPPTSEIYCASSVSEIKPTDLCGKFD